MLVHVGSFFPTILHALRTEHLVEDVSAKPLDYILIYSLRQTITFSFLGNKFSHPIFVEKLNLHASQVLQKDRCLPTLQKQEANFSINHISVMLTMKHLNASTKFYKLF